MALLLRVHLAATGWQLLCCGAFNQWWSCMGFITLLRSMVQKRVKLLLEYRHVHRCHAGNRRGSLRQHACPSAAPVWHLRPHLLPSSMAAAACSPLGAVRPPAKRQCRSAGHAACRALAQQTTDADVVVVGAGAAGLAAAHFAAVSGARVRLPLEAALARQAQPQHPCTLGLNKPTEGCIPQHV